MCILYDFLRNMPCCHQIIALNQSAWRVFYCASIRLFISYRLKLNNVPVDIEASPISLRYTPAAWAKVLALPPMLAENGWLSLLNNVNNKNNNEIP